MTKYGMSLLWLAATLGCSANQPTTDSKSSDIRNGTPSTLAYVAAIQDTSMS